MPIAVPQRAERSLRLLLGMRLPRVTAALYPYGFSHAVVLEGWSLLRSMGFESASKGSNGTPRPTRTLRAKTTQVRLISENRTADEKTSQRLGTGSEAKNKGGDKR